MSSNPSSAIAFFPGQGSQHVGMAQELYENFKVVRETFEEASDATGLHLKRLCFEGPESELLLTENTQPALLTASVATFRVAEQEQGFIPSLVAGHSLGEYSALVAAGAFPLGAAAYWVRERGKAMQSAVPAGQGGMAALLNMEDSDILRLCSEAVEKARALRNTGESSTAVACTLSPANFNAPGQTVIAGSLDAIQEAIALIKAGTYKGKAIPLAVSAPFHCALMSPARDRMAELFAQAQPGEKPTSLKTPYVANCTAKLTSEPTAVFENLVQQVDHPVLWKQSVSLMIERGYSRAIEFGPGKVLQGLAKRIAGLYPDSKFECSGVSDLATLKGMQR